MLSTLARRITPVTSKRVTLSSVTCAVRQKHYKSVYPDLTFPNISTSDLVFGLSEGIESKYGEKVALRHGNASISYNALKKKVMQCTQSLKLDHGIKKGDVTAILMPNCLEYATALHGFLEAGSVVSPINPAYTGNEVAFQLTDAGATRIVISKELLPASLDAIKKCNIKDVFVVGDDITEGIPYESLFQNDGSKFELLKTDFEEVCLLPYSSGTTGKPKGVMLTHNNLVRNNVQLIDDDLLSVKEKSKLVGVLPFFHMYGLQAILNASLLSGSSISCLSKFDPVEFLTTLQDHEVCTAHLVPPIVVFMAKHPICDKFDLSKLKDILCGAAPLSTEITELTFDRYPRLNTIRQGYGMTELSPVSHIDSFKNGCIGSAGVLLPNTEMKIIRPDGTECDVAEDGEVCIKGPQVMKGYLNNKKATDEVFCPDGYLKTGDIGYIERDGIHLHISDRVKELIKTKGFQVAPAELEGHLLHDHRVADACVIGIEDERSGELPKAFIVLKNPEDDVDGTLSKEIVDNINRHMASFKSIVEWEVIEAIPKSPSGKILRRVLRDQEKANRGAKSSSN